MDSVRTLALGALVLSSCTGTNAAYESSGGRQSSGDTGPTGGAVTSDSPPASGGATTNDSTGQPSDGSSADGPTSGSSTDAETEGAPSCWFQPIQLAVPQSVLEQPLADVPILIDLSKFLGPVHPGTLRFYEGDTLLAHEFENGEALAWVKIPQLQPDAVVELKGVSGVECDAVPTARPPAEVWSNHYVGVWHFDSVEGDPPAFMDSAHGIPLALDTGSARAQRVGQLGHYLHKDGTLPLEAFDERLDLSDTPLSTLAWVRLAENETSPLPWNTVDARHREVLAKLPGYRLNAVYGQVAPKAKTSIVPFFNISELITGAGLHDNVSGTTPVPEAEWTMLAGTYDGPQLHLFSNGDRQATADSEHSPGASGDDRLAVGRWLLGGIDEIRISDVARSEGWIQVQYLSMTGAELLSYGEALRDNDQSARAK